MDKEISKKDVEQKEQTELKIKPSDNMDENKASAIFSKIKAKFDIKVEVEVSSQAIQNKIDGCEREQKVRKELEKQYPEKKGYLVLSEKYLLDKDGNIVKDPETGTARRIDFVVVKDGKVVDMIEVTSKTAPKLDQSVKELRIRSNGGNYIKVGDQIVKVPNNVETRIERRD